MAKILAFAGSNNSQSINKQTLGYVVEKLQGHEVKLIKLEDYDAPIFGLDFERENGLPENITKLHEEFKNADGILIATPEHNSSYPAFLKNILDWLSRTEGGSIFLDKPVFIMSTSPGGRAGQGVREHMAATIPFRGASKVDHFGIDFSEKFDTESQSFKDADLEKDLMSKLSDFF